MQKQIQREYKAIRKISGKGLDIFERPALSPAAACIFAQKIRPEEWGSLRTDIRGVCIKIKNCIWDLTYDQPLNKPPKMERKIGL